MATLITLLQLELFKIRKYIDRAFQRYMGHPVNVVSRKSIRIHNGGNFRKAQNKKIAKKQKVCIKWVIFVVKMLDLAKIYLLSKFQPNRSVRSLYNWFFAFRVQLYIACGTESTYWIFSGTVHTGAEKMCTAHFLNSLHKWTNGEDILKTHCEHHVLISDILSCICS